MFKNVSKLVISLGLVTCIGAGLVAGCSNKSEKLLPTNLAYYDGTHYGEYSDKYPEYNPELWRNNSGPSIRTMPEGSDPAIFDNTSRDGYFYLANGRGYDYGFYRSDDLENWEKGDVNVKIRSSDNPDLATTDYMWAPEYMYDEADGGWYYFFLSIAFDGNSTIHMPVVFRSRTITEGFEIVNFKDGKSCGEVNVHDYNEAEYPHYYAKYALFQPDKYRAAREREAERTGAAFLVPDESDKFSYNNGYMMDIDLHPYVDPVTNEKYLYMSTTPNSIGVMRMINWLQPDYDSYRILTYAQYYTVEDFTAEKKTGAAVDKIVYEQIGSNDCNEGPYVTYHNGKYYLTYSINHYQDSCYAVMQAVADSPTGPFRKLTDAENGLLLSSDMDDNKYVSGTGHHSFINYKVNGQDKIYIAYHSHDDVELKGGARHVNLDEVKWVTITDKDGKSLDVMHVNGPTVTAQPTFGIGKEYCDISEEATVSLESGKIASGSSLKWINDGLIGLNNLTCQEFEDKYIGETVISETSTFKISFNTARAVRGFMVYNSKHGGVNDEKDYFFERVKNISIVCEENGEEKTYTISKLDVDKKLATLYSEFAGITTLEGVARGYGVYAEFNELKVKSITFTVEKPADKSAVAVSEIAVLGKPVKEG